MKKYQYQIIRYIHDHFTGEYVNVGVIVYSRDDRFLRCMITGRYQRITQMFPEANGRWIMRILSNFNLRVNKFAKELNELFPPNEDLTQITNSILVPDNNAIQLSKTKEAIDVSLEAAIKDIFNTQVEKYVVVKRDKGSLLDDDVWKIKYKSYFEKYGIDKRLQVHEVKVPNDVFSFNKSWKNEKWHCYEPLSFVLQEKDSIKDKVYKWAGKIQGLQQTEEVMHLTLLTSISPKHKDLVSFIDKYLKIDTHRLKVDIVTDDQAEELAQQIKSSMERHDSKL